MPSEGNPKPLFATADGNEAWLLLLEKVSLGLVRVFDVMLDVAH